MRPPPTLFAVSVSGALILGGIIGFAIAPSSRSKNLDVNSPNAQLEARAKAMAYRLSRWKGILDVAESGDTTRVIEMLRTEAIGDYFTVKSLAAKGITFPEGTPDRLLRLEEVLSKVERFQRMKETMEASGHMEPR